MNTAIPWDCLHALIVSDMKVVLTQAGFPMLRPLNTQLKRGRNLLEVEINASAQEEAIQGKSNASLYFFKEDLSNPIIGNVP